MAHYCDCSYLRVAWRSLYPDSVEDDNMHTFLLYGIPNHDEIPTYAALLYAIKAATDKGRRSAPAEDVDLIRMRIKEGLRTVAMYSRSLSDALRSRHIL